MISVRGGGEPLHDASTPLLVHRPFVSQTTSDRSEAFILNDIALYIVRSEVRLNLALTKFAVVRDIFYESILIRIRKFTPTDPVSCPLRRPFVSRHTAKHTVLTSQKKEEVTILLTIQHLYQLRGIFETVRNIPQTDCVCAEEGAGQKEGRVNGR